MSSDPPSAPLDTPPIEQVGPNRHRNMLIVLIGIIAVAALSWWWAHAGSAGGRTGSRSGKGRPAVTVGMARVVRFDMPLLITVTGTVQPTVAATVRTQVAGVLTAIRFTEGQAVRKGQILAQVDPRTAAQAVDQVRGTMTKDAAQLASARVDLVRYQTLWQQDSIAKQQVDSQAALVRQLEGTVAADRAAVRSAGLTLGFTSVRAPVSGRVGLRQVDLGSYVTPSDTNGIVVITVDSPIDVSFAVPQNQLAQVASAARAPGGLSVTTFDQSNASRLAEGKFLTFDNTIDATTGTIKGKARFANADTTLFPNQFVNVRLNVGRLAGALVVPISAVRHGPNGDFVFTLRSGDRAHLVNVVTGPSDGQRIVITKGLGGNETVITEGADKLDEGSPVSVGGAHKGAGRGPDSGRRHRANGGGQ